MNLPTLPAPLKQVAVAGYHDGTLKEPLEDYYDAEQMHAYAVAYAAALSPPALEGMDGWITWANYADRMVTVVLDEWPKAGVQVNTRIRLASPAPAQQAVTVDDAMVLRALFAFMPGACAYASYEMTFMRAALTAALAPNAAGDTPPATQEGDRG